MHRRDFLVQSFGLVGGILLESCSDPDHPIPKINTTPKTLESLDGAFGFIHEGNPPMDMPLGTGLAGRRFTDLFNLPLDGSVVGNDQFFIRTMTPLNHARRFPWKILIKGWTEAPLVLELSELEALSKPQEMSVMECAGNDPGGQFGLLSAATWEGASIQSIFDLLKARTQSPMPIGRILISGADEHVQDGHSIPGASWIFTEEQLISAGAFLAFRLNDEVLSPDNGFPVRLVVPGWYGCTCIKWIEEMTWVPENMAATMHMQEYAERTHQSGIPQLAKNFIPAKFSISALPVRIEKWKVADGIVYRIVGLLWGGEKNIELLQIQIGKEKLADVEFVMHRKSAMGWSVWTYLWLPENPGEFTIRLFPKDPSAPAPRLKSGYYARTCRIRSFKDS